MREIRRWLVRLSLVAMAAGSIWWFGFMPPRLQRIYTQGAEQFRAGDLQRAIETLQQARRLNPFDVRVNTMLGQAYLQLGQVEQAESHFALAYRFRTTSDEAAQGLVQTRLLLDKGAEALPVLERMAAAHPKDKQVQMWIGEAYTKTGDNLKAAQTYRVLLERDPFDPHARQAFLALYGYSTFRPELPDLSPTFQRPAQLQTHFRTHGDFFQVREGADWRTVYLVGVNIGPARPEEFPSTASRDFSTYSDWFQQIVAMHANTIRTYSILPPAFYQALLAFNESSSSRLWLIQEVWIDEGDQDLYNAKAEEEFRRVLTSTINVLHGQENLPFRRGFNYGIYTADVSRYVLALAVGREVEPRQAQLTNLKNPTRTSYQGRFISLPKGSPVEAWFARMCDQAAAYEFEKYNAQRPITVVNWPPLDPLTHPSEGTHVDELRYRRMAGQVVEEQPRPDGIYDDMDVVSLDVTKFRAEREFTAGLFALYHVYQHWPDFLLNDAAYAQAKDSQGQNRYLGYLQDLKKAHPNFPLFIGEYGVSSSLGVSHVHPQGWNSGGFDEKQQAELLVRFTNNIRESGCAGGLVFEWQDEWFKHVGDVEISDFERPWDRNPLWFNPMDVEKNYGVVRYFPPGPTPLLRGDPQDWIRAEQFAFPPAANGRTSEISALYAYADFAYFYVRLDVEPGALDWSHWNYWIALNTLPGKAGSKKIPGIRAPVEGGANFLIQLSDPSHSRFLIAENYNPSRKNFTAGKPGEARWVRKEGMRASLADTARFVERTTVVNRARYGRDGHVFPEIDYNASRFPYGTADPANSQFSSHSLWHVTAEKGMIELRIPWGMLLVTDPSSRQVFAGTEEKRRGGQEAVFPISDRTEGISLAAFALYVPGPGLPQELSSALPPLARNGVLSAASPIYSWEKWDRVEYRPYYKQGYAALQKAFGSLTK